MPAFITITARLARPPEVRETNSGTTICNLTLPNDTGWGDNKTTTWWTCTLFGKRAEAAAKHLDKGQWVTVNGEPSLRSTPSETALRAHRLKSRSVTGASVAPRCSSHSLSKLPRAMTVKRLSNLPF